MRSTSCWWCEWYFFQKHFSKLTFFHHEDYAMRCLRTHQRCLVEKSASHQWRVVFWIDDIDVKIHMKVVFWIQDLNLLFIVISLRLSVLRKNLRHNEKFTISLRTNNTSHYTKCDELAKRVRFLNVQKYVCVAIYWIFK